MQKHYNIYHGWTASHMQISSKFLEQHLREFTFSSLVQGLAPQHSPAHVTGGRINKLNAVTLGSAHMIPRAVSSTSGVTTDNDQVR